MSEERPSDAEQQWLKDCQNELAVARNGSEEARVLLRYKRAAESTLAAKLADDLGEAGSVPCDACPVAHSHGAPPPGNYPDCCMPDPDCPRCQGTGRTPKPWPELRVAVRAGREQP